MTKLILIIVIQLIYVPLLTLRTITMVKNLKMLTALFGFLEAFTYVFGLAIVLSGEQNTLEMVVYALGFSLGLFLGVYVEQKMAIGFISVFVNINHQNSELVEALRKLGFGVTVYQGRGRDGNRYRLEILTRRKRQKELYNIVGDFEPKAFIVAYEPKTFKGGYLSELMRRRVKLNAAKMTVEEEIETEPFVASSVNEIKRESRELLKNWKN